MALLNKQNSRTWRNFDTDKNRKKGCRGYILINKDKEMTHPYEEARKQ